jgi:hypothetical protein
MTEAELTLLRSLAEAEVVTFMPEGNTSAVPARFVATLSLRDLPKAGWVELEVSEEKKRRRGRHQQTIPGAAARCTEAGRDACGCWTSSNELL